MNYSANVSALRAASLSQQITANDVANINTNEYRSKRLDLESGPEGRGVRPAAVRENTSPGPSVEELQTYEDEQGRVRQRQARVEGSNTDLAEETVQMIEDEVYMQSNAEAIAAHHRATGNVLDILV
ncbi:MAG: flagellar biosynthesis protein FlgG [Desulfonatronovibrionaceae bacterium]